MKCIKRLNRQLLRKQRNPSSQLLKLGRSLRWTCVIELNIGYNDSQYKTHIVVEYNDNAKDLGGLSD
jgi:hypothetical protein